LDLRGGVGTEFDTPVDGEAHPHPVTVQLDLADRPDIHPGDLDVVPGVETRGVGDVDGRVAHAVDVGDAVVVEGDPHQRHGAHCSPHAELLGIAVSEPELTAGRLGGRLA